MPTSSYIEQILNGVGEERMTRIMWYVVYGFQTLLLFRFFLKLIEAKPKAEFLIFVYSVSKGLVAPFLFLPSTIRGDGVIEWASLAAIGVYTSLAWLGLREIFTRYGTALQKDAEFSKQLGQEVGVSNV